MNNINLDIWIDSLTESQKKQVLKDLIERMLDTEDVRLGDLSPYWEADGEPIVHDQKVWNEE